MVKIMLHFAIKLFSDYADVDFVIQCGYCTNDREFLHEFGFCCGIEWIKQFFLDLK